MKRNNGLTMRLIAGLGSAAIASSTGVVLAASGYAFDSAGKVVTSDFNECVQIDSWGPESVTAECDPALAARLEADRLAAEKAGGTTELAALERPAALPTLVRLSDKRNVMFEFNSAVLTPAAERELDTVLGKIRQLNEVDGIQVVGHTDSSGPESYNQKLSEQRAASVEKFLKSRGIASSVLSARGEGESNPVAENNSREGRARNRRVDILISGNAVE